MIQQSAVLCLTMCFPKIICAESAKDNPAKKFEKIKCQIKV